MKKLIIWTILTFMLVSSAFGYTIVTSEPLTTSGVAAETDPFYFTNPNAYYNSSTLPAFVDTNETTRVDALYTNVSDWNTAFSWGNHALNGYWTSSDNESDPFYFSNPNSYYNSSIFAITDYYNKSEVYNKTEVDNLLASVTYLPTSLNVVNGTPTNDTIGNISYSGDNYMTVVESAGANPLTIYINFTGVTTTPDFLTMGHQYSGNHEIELRLWDYSASSWELYDTIVQQGSIIKDNIAIVDGADHVSGGLVQARFTHAQNGNPSHFFILDFLNLVSGSSTLTTTEHDGLSGRDNITTNHPNIIDFFYTETEIDANNWINNSEVNISESQVYDLSHTVDTNETTRVDQILIDISILDNFSLSTYNNSESSAYSGTLDDTNILYYSFNNDNISSDDPFDLSPSGDDGTGQGTIVTGTTGILEEAFNYTDNTDYVDTGKNHFNDELTAFTVNAWVIAGSGQGNNAGRGIVCNYNSGTDTPFCMSLQNGYPRCMTHDGDFAEASNSSYDLRDDTYHMITCTWNASGGSDNIKLYVDGVLHGTGTQDGLYASTTSTKIGRYGRTPSSYIGTIDEVSIWTNDTLTTAEVVELYNSGDSLNFYDDVVGDVEYETIYINSSIDVNGKVFADDYITKSKVPVIDGYSALTQLDNIKDWIKDGKIQYKEHYAHTKIKNSEKLIPIRSETCVDTFHIGNFSTTTECTSEITGYTEDSVEEYGLSMETRVAELEKMVYELYLEVWKLK